MLSKRIFVKSVLQGIVSYLFLFLFTAGSLSAQVSVFQTLTTSDGLPSNYIFSAAEDEDGFLWLGTDKGLARYDGFRWQLYNTDQGLPGNYITQVLKAGKKGLWLTIGSKGLYYFDITTRATRLAADDALDHFTQTDSSGNLFFYKRENKPEADFLYCYIEPLTLKKNIVFSGEQITGTGYSAFADFPNRRIVCVPSGKNSLQTLHHIRPGAGWQLEILPESLETNTLLRRVTENIYVTRHSILYRQTGKAVRQVVLYEQDNSYLNYLRYRDELVVWNEKNGLYFVHDNGTVRHFTGEDGLGSDIVTGVYKLKNGQLLICTLGGGLNYKLPEGNAILHTGNQAVKGLTQNANSLYAAMDKQLLKFDFNSKHTTIFPINEKYVQNADLIRNELYISTLTGLSVYKEAGNLLHKTNSIPLGSGISNVIGSDNRLFAGTFGIQVVEILKSNIRFDTTTPYVSEKIQDFSEGLISYNYEDGLQFAYHDGRRIHVSVKNGLPSNAVYHVQEYKDSFWISTKKGVAVYTKGKVVKTIGVSEGLMGNRAIFSFHDAAGTGWILTDKYLGKLSGNKLLTYVSIPVKNGANDYVHTALYNSTLNTLITGTLKQIYLNNLDNISQPAATMPPQLQAVWLDHKKITDARFSTTLQYDQLSFEFAPYEINPFGKSTIYYKLSGYDDQFTELKDSLTIHFSKLRSGSYAFIAKVVNEAGVESPEVILCRFAVEKPFWQTAGFIFLLIGASMALTYFIVAFSQKQKQKQREKERQLEQQLVKERERISRELHDNLGSSLVTIIAQSDNIESRLLHQQTDEALKKVQELSDQSRHTMDILRETIWAVQEQSHTYENFINRIRDFLRRAYSGTAMEWQCEAVGNLNNNISPEQTLNLFRCIQECTQNIIKHSGAGRADYQFAASGHQLKIEIRDNGKGFKTGELHPGQGLRNIRHRIEELNGTLQITSGEAGGTLITIETVL